MVEPSQGPPSITGHGPSRHPVEGHGYGRAAIERVARGLDDEDGRALPEQEPVAGRVERARGVLRVVVPLREGAHVAERGEGDREERRLRAAGQDDVALARAALLSWR